MKFFFSLLLILTSLSLEAQLVYPGPYVNNCANGCSTMHWYEPGRWAWVPRYAPAWWDCFYFAPKCYYQRLDVNRKHDMTIAGFLGIREGKRLNGVMYGIETGYVCRCPNTIWTQFDFSFAQGQLKGHYTKGKWAHYADLGGYVGFDVVAYNFRMVPYVGVGYSLHRFTFDEKSYRHRTLRERYHIIYVPFGIKFNYAVTPCFEVGLNVEGRPQADATLKTNLITHNRWELTKTTGYLVELPICWNIPCFNFYWKIVVVPFWKLTQYGKSSEFEDCDVKIVSPKQQYRDWGGTLEVGTLF